MKKRIRLGQYDFPSPEWANVSQEAKNLIKGMLCIDPAERLQIDAVMRNNWIAVRALLYNFVFNKFSLYFFKSCLFLAEIYGGTRHSLTYRTRSAGGRGNVAGSARGDDAIAGDNAR